MMFLLKLFGFKQKAPTCSVCIDQSMDCDFTLNLTYVVIPLDSLCDVNINDNRNH